MENVDLLDFEPNLEQKQVDMSHYRSCLYIFVIKYEAYLASKNGTVSERLTT